MAFLNSIYRMTMMLQATERRVWFLYSDRMQDGKKPGAIWKFRRCRVVAQ